MLALIRFATDHHLPFIEEELLRHTRSGQFSHGEMFDLAEALEKRREQLHTRKIFIGRDDEQNT